MQKVENPLNFTSSIFADCFRILKKLFTNVKFKSSIKALSLEANKHILILIQIL